MSEDKEDESGALVGHFECINDECNSSDGLAVYQQEDGKYNGYCWSAGCESYFTHEEIMESELGDQLDDYEPVPKKRRPPITKTELKEIIDNTVYDDTKFRAISKETNEFFKVRSKVVDGVVTERHYPVTKDGKPSAYRKRVCPKDFRKGYAGYNGMDCDLFGQTRFQRNGKYVLIVGGEEDTMAAYQMLWDAQKKRNMDHFEPVAVVSSTNGEGCFKQIKHNYEFLTSFSRIIICPDQDDAGKKALEKILTILPVGKTYVMDCPAKDANECLKTGFATKFVRSFYQAAEHNPSGIIGSGGLLKRVVTYAKMPRLPLPPFLHRLQKMMAGGIPLGSIINLASASGAGKSTLINEVLYYWIFNSPYRVGVYPAEGGVDYFAESLLSRHLGKKIALVGDVDEKVEYLEDEKTQARADNLFFDEHGHDRFDLLNGEGAMTLDIFKERCEHMVRAMDVKVLLLDPLTKLLEGEDFKDTQKFMKWQNDFVEQNKCIIANIVQVRKSASGKKANSTGADLHEEDMSGAGTILQTGFCNILFMRNKEAEDETERNSTKLMMSKCRWSGITGPAGYMYYDNETHTLHDKDDYFMSKIDDGYGEEEEVFKESGAFEKAEASGF